MSAPVDVLAVMYKAATVDLPLMDAVDMWEARAAVVELITAARDAAAVLQAKAGPMEQETPSRLYAALACVGGAK